MCYTLGHIFLTTRFALYKCFVPEFVLHQCSCSGSAAWVRPTELFVAAVILLDQHGCPATLLELLLFVVAAEFTLDKDGGQRHLLIKCILPRGQRKNLVSHERERARSVSTWLMQNKYNWVADSC